METKATKLLLVDDEEGITELFEEMLEAVGYDCSTAASGEEALEIISEGPVDLALVDIMMPGMSGLTLFQQARALHPDLAVIFVTAVRDIHTAVENLVNGAYNYLVKPVTRETAAIGRGADPVQAQRVAGGEAGPRAAGGEGSATDAGVGGKGRGSSVS